MEPFRYHLFICDQQKPEGVPCCVAHGSRKVLEGLRREIASQGLLNEVQVTTCGSLGLCEHGPNMVVYPEGVWYSGVRPEDVSEIVSSHFRSGKVVERLVRTDTAALRSEIQQNRDRWLAALKARDAAGVLPDDLTQTIRGFQESRAILTALELDLFTAVGTGATATKVAGQLHTHRRATEMLLNALVAMELLEKNDGVFSNSAPAARYFVEGSPDSARLSLLHNVSLWSSWSTLTDCVRAGTSAEQASATADFDDSWTQPFIAAMHRNAQERAPLVVQAVGVEGVRRMLDVGGGSGAYSIAFASAHPALRAEVLDRANVIPIAQGHIEKAGLSGRVTTRAGDLRSDTFGTGYDLVFISAICHMLSPEENRDLLKKTFAALAPGGRTVIQDFILEPQKTAPRFAALFSLNMLVNTPAGSSYSEPEYAAWLSETGFQEVQRVRLPGPTGLMLGRRAAA